MSMKLNLTVSEINALSSAGISFREDGEYSEDEALELLRMLAEAEENVRAGCIAPMENTFSALRDSLLQRKQQ